LPLLLYRVHSGGRAYGTDWQRRLGQSAVEGTRNVKPLPGDDGL
jgi:hypothetical protein